MDNLSKGDKIYYPEMDIARGIAILLVVFAHCIQCGNGAEYYENLNFFDNIIYKSIYSFHMPLLMMVSAFLLAKNINKKTVLQIISGRVTNILLPIIAWNLIVQLPHIISNNLFDWLITFCKSTITSFWFLWAVLFSTVATTFIYKYGKNKWYWYILATLLCFFTPDIWNSECYKFMFFCYICGFFYKKNIKDRNMILLFTFILWILLLQMYDYNSYIYTTGWTLLGRTDMLICFIRDIYRVAIGVIGSAMVLLTIIKLGKYISENVLQIFKILGKNSMGIYIISTFMNIVLQRTTKEFKPSIIMNILETLLIISGSYIIVYMLKLNKWSKKILLGGR